MLQVRCQPQCEGQCNTSDESAPSQAFKGVMSGAGPSLWADALGLASDLERDASSWACSVYWLAVCKHTVSYGVSAGTQAGGMPIQDGSGIAQPGPCPSCLGRCGIGYPCATPVQREAHGRAARTNARIKT